MDDYELWLMSTSRATNTIRMRLAHIRSLARQVPLYSATTYDLERILASTRHLAPETRKATLSSWRLFYHWAYRTGRVATDPTLEMESIKVKPRMPRIAPDDAIHLALLTATLPQRAMILLGRGACLRLSEIATLHTKCREHDRLRVLGKGDKERYVYINDEVLAPLEELERTQGSGYYFPGRFGGHIHPQALNKIITRVTGCNPHSLRHAGATATYRENGDIRSLQVMLGHASLATTQRYLAIDEDSLRRVANGTSLGISGARSKGFAA